MPTELEADRIPCDVAPSAARQRLPPGIAAGALVTARDETWRVLSCVTHADCGEARLRGPAGERALLWPFDRLRPVSRERRPRRVSKHGWARAIAALIRESHAPGRLLATSDAADILPYQLDPAILLAGGARGVLLADEVGLGKTVQAGWIVADVLARDPAARVLVCAPAGLLAQWRDELRRFFSVECAVADARWLRRRMSSLPTDVSPWCLPGVYVASVDFIKRHDIADGVAREIWDALVVDEAHGAAAPTERHGALMALSRRARRVVLITATPFAGDQASFRSMVALADSLGPVPIFRRSRGDVAMTSRRRHRFRLVRLDPAETRLQRALERYTGEVWRRTRADAPARLAMAVLRKRALSSPAAAARSLRRRAALLAARDPLPQQLGLFAVLDDDGAQDDEPMAALAAPGLDETDRERKWLEALATLADAAVSADGKRRFLARLLSRLGGNAAVVFTEYRDTLKDLARDYTTALQLHGGMTRAEREDAQRRFNADGGLLLATDAAAEGLNLHGRCRLVVNYELPWNPARLEQRIGRVDRVGQTRTVHAISLVARDSAEDLVVSKLLRRLERIAVTLGAKDRLAAFLDDARTAQFVIGGTPVTDERRETLPPPDVVSSISQAAFEAADRLETINRLGAGPAGSCRDDLVVCRLRGSRIVPPGTVFVFEWRAVAGTGSVQAAEPIAIHAAKAIDPRQAGALRYVAALARQRADGLLAEARARQQSLHHALAACERRLLRTSRQASEPQPGLFARHGRGDDEAGGGREVHLRRIETLDADLDLRSELFLAGLLFVGPGRP